MADRSGVRVGYRIIKIDTNNTIKQSHDHIVHHLQTAVGHVTQLIIMCITSLMYICLDTAEDDASITLQSYDW